MSENPIENEMSDKEILELDVENLRQGMLLNVASVKKSVSRSWRPVFVAFPIVVALAGGMFIGESTLLNILAVALVAFSIAGSLLARHVIYGRSTRNVDRHLRGLEPMKKPLDLKISLPSSFIATPREVYDKAASLMSEEWQIMLPELEKQIMVELATDS